jgi:aldose 1-epimerase
MNRALLVFLLVPMMTQAGNYSTERVKVNGVEVIHLKDAARKIEVTVIPTLGNNACEMKVNGKDILWSPYRSVAELLDKPVQMGNPLLSPWANRIDGNAYWADGKKYLLNLDLKNFRLDSNQLPMHGLVVYAKEWKVTRLEADNRSATVTSTLEFWRRPDWMAQFPFAHNLEMTYRLEDGRLEVAMAVHNLSSEAMPLSLGFHTYYRISESPRDDWQIHVPAERHVETNQLLIPTGELKPATLSDPQPLRNFRLDDGFAGLRRDSAGKAELWVKGSHEQIKVILGPKYKVAVVFAPPGRDYVCFEPMTGVTDAFNLAHEGKYKDLQSIPPGGTWKESYWIVPEGY